MSRLLYSATLSLDGFIAGVDGEMSWLTGHLAGADPEAEALLPEIGALRGPVSLWCRVRR